MKLSKMSTDELELYSYADLTKMILEEEGKPLNTPTIFRKICDLLSLSDSEYMDKIGDYYTGLTTDKNFVLLSDGNWDLRDHHPVQVDLDEDDVLDESEELEEEFEDEEILEDDLGDGDIDDDMDLDDEDDTEDLTILSEEELED